MLALVLLLTLATTEAQQHDGHAPAVEQPVTLLPGLGRLHHPIATGSAEAQRFFDQGLTLVYGFNHDEAVRAFRRAAELDPASPMPHWGIALALGPNINLDVDRDREQAAYDAVQRARQRAAAAPAAERAYVDALAERYSNDPKADLKKLAARYMEAMRALVATYPDDLDAATLYAESLMDLNPWLLWAPDGTPAAGTDAIVATLESVLRRDPMHVGANHYYIHAVEASRAPGRALNSAQRLETLVPAAGHLVHMPAHIYMRTGNFTAAASSNAKAAEVDREYIKRRGAEGVYPSMYYNHNLDFLASAAMMSGQFKEAKQAADLVVANTTPMIAQMAMLEPFAAKTLFVLLRFARWDEVMALPAPDPAHRLLTTLFHFGRGVAQAARGHAAAAGQERAAYVEARQAIAPESDWGYNKARDMLKVCDAALDGWIARAAGDDQGAVAAWRRAVAAEDALNYDEPPDWFYPARESLGAALLRANRAADAAQVFTDDLVRNPKNGRSLFGLWQAQLAAKNPAATATRRRFKDAWRHADAGLRLEDF
ncbi:MAG: repeat-containing protein [Acidobacteria bacterium]|nr:repeat-containing protein [Acidobacteriota bacterium]